ncbi:CPBP family intramembrane glutamic endopeptidase [Dictyobacter kobayashii]|uniref:Protease n=1 Tax=Dictyobacter kobayashii TaxID=2014872 RepID=A0A402APY5_9CHLR|nr:type II CAAX endopeptidase family protein [Dictyobacter kobayashii]GCE21050.1 protease [Dictyobacter kobayashii]
MKNLFWNRDERRLRAGWRQLLLILLLGPIIYATIYAINFPLYILLSLIAHHLYFVWAININHFLLIPNNGFLSACATIVLSWFIMHFINRERLANLGYRLNWNWWMDFLFGCLLGLILNCTLVLIEYGVGWLSLKQMFISGAGNEHASFAVLLLAWFIQFLYVGIFEETLARGYPIRNFAQGLRNNKVKDSTVILLLWLTTSILFGVGHYGNPHITVMEIINLCVAGLALGLGYILTGSMGLSIGLHAAWDFAQGNLFGFAVAGQQPVNMTRLFAFQQQGPTWLTGGAAGPDGGLLSTFMFILAMLIILGYMRWRYGKIRIETELSHFERHQKEIDKAELA